MKTLISAATAIALLATPVAADEIREALEAALEAYNEGDTQHALEELDSAKDLLQALKTDDLVQFLPEAPDGWTRTIDTGMNEGLAVMGGGSGAEATYDGNSQSITIVLMADNPVVAGMAGMISNAGLMGAEVERIGRQKFMLMDGQLSGLVDSRILVQAQGGELDVMRDLLETMDFRALRDFGS